MQHLKRLVNALDGDDVYFFIHIDKKVDNPIKFDENYNVTLLNSRLDVKWGGYSLVEATFLLLQAAFKANAYDYFVLLSGVDYPVRSNRYIKSVFVENKGKSFINVVKMPGNGKSLGRMDYYHIEGDYRGVNLLKMLCIRVINRGIKFSHIKRNLPKQYSHYTMYGGSTWWALHKDFVKYLMNYRSTDPGFFNFFKHTYIPDEMIFQTIIMNSPFKQLVTNGLIYHDWSVGKPPYPSLISDIHLPIIRSETCDIGYGPARFIFARKFNDESINILLEINKIRELPGF